ncbi:Palmitoyltransferase [Hondaea fermentalgiana]|uniref:Palmitoyltransferase n=1 Tax=Hondaea fermentalgiana TaxID=2315210 RepID=A0A2R5GFR0_9STRA|nr:Palmitoyltransferase [Hondaea fermentalgiana]|eukprot:GBG27081.1 Palmitoyltransferase [Hondaea fermentalgiana]
MSGREELLRATKAAYDFSVKVVNNAHALLEHSRSTRVRVQGGIEEIRTGAQRDIAALETLESCKGDALSRAKAAEAKVNDRDEAFSSLRITLDALGSTALPPWLPNAGGGMHTESGQGSLLDFVDVREIETLRKSAQDLAADALQQVEEVRVAAEALSERKRVALEVDMLRAVQRIEDTTPASSTLGEAATIFDVLEEWMRKVSAEVDEQGAIVKVLSRGSFGLAGLYDHLLDASELGPPDAQLVRPVRDFLAHDFAAMDKNNNNKNNNDITTPGGGTMAQSHTQTSSQPDAAASAGPVEEHDDLREQQQQQQQQQQQDSESHVDLRQSIARCEAHMKRGLKRMAASVDRVKTVSQVLTQARKRYPVEAHAAVEAAVQVGHEVAARAEGLLQICQDAQREVDLASQEFVKLDEFYHHFQNAQAEAETELRRRWESLAKAEELAREHQAKMLELVDAELAARAKFDETYGVYLPDGYCSALRPKAEPTSFQYVIVNADDAHNLHDCTQHLSDLQAASFSAVTDEGVALETDARSTTLNVVKDDVDAASEAQTPATSSASAHGEIASKTVGEDNDDFDEDKNADEDIDEGIIKDDVNQDEDEDTDSNAEISSWVLFGYFVGVFYVVSQEVLPGVLYHVIGAVHGILAVMVIVFTLRCSLIDPEDQEEYPGNVPRQELSFCHICRHTVRKSSKHCRTCNKCVAGFDHHCVWIQQCIGSKNYTSFFWLLMTATVLLGLEALTGLSALVLYTRSVLVATNERSHTIFVAVYFCVSLMATCAVLNLLIFHVRLSFRGETTYDYLVAKARRSRSKQQQQQDAEVLPVRRMRCFGLCGSAHQIGGSVRQSQSQSQEPQQPANSGPASSQAVSEGHVRLI